MRLLVVEDDPDLNRQLTTALTDAGYVVEEACPPRYADAIGCWARLIMGDFGSVLTLLSPMMGTFNCENTAQTCRCSGSLRNAIVGLD